ncbi:c-type cytochrome biogenesis protein CcmI [Phaeobacter porticola]|uniref:Cytochrome c-type biogenesis protein CycH n=1 Tax=Phaeobacter porticola TaxID=1844006 RepID=A0A1L3I5P6_9RHOB|nr:c-type cytochrome biogenesis protein CcmI [Phaeobacter porticola]APG47361.1 cytochrome c-type biogenesis protein CycH [Phaeobacter porticola]
MTFWIVISLITLATACLLSLVLLRGRDSGEPAAAYDLQVYRQQLRDVDKDLARGVLQEADADRIRTEISRRILTADAQAQAATTGRSQPRALTGVVATALAGLVCGGTYLLYANLGAPGYSDLGLQLRIDAAAERAANRPSQAAAEADAPERPDRVVEPGYATLVDQLRDTASKRVDDAQGQALLSRHEANLGNFAAAAKAKANYIRIMSGDVEARDFGELAELQIMAAGGYVSPEAEDALRTTLTLNRFDGGARYYWGLMMAQIGRPDVAYEVWSETLAMGPEDAPWVTAISAQIEDIAFRAGVDYTPITPGSVAIPGQNPNPDADLAGPSADDIAAAEEMSTEDRQQMIRGMVESLSDRLATTGGTPQEWARLIGALAVLQETARAQAIYSEAQEVFAETPEALATITAAAENAGLTQ